AGLLAGCGQKAAPPGVTGDPVRGRLALTQYACHACHQIPGITGSAVYVGPPLDAVARRRVIARNLPNTPANLARWIREPQKIDPHTAMPALGVSEEDAEDMVAYLLTLD
ncbi:MAG TPA: cytochrome c, partial [Noviherbaspirillum sp.]